MHLAPVKHPDGSVDEWCDVFDDGRHQTLIDLKEEWERRLNRAKTPLRAMRCLRRILEIEALCSQMFNHNQIV